ncbi:hypothetical protein AQI88_40085 [Streptomyces cellostaticus]|uniref:Uncharacterized protein n=1 Tax=Streptomyces cellostaticus TaxID=67285 RepID=A0A101N8H9_9ACTN|nr:hypothetical protein [Streptomyces cellostaticus]KUM88500.1 hypothetical protein AQI88_40085 [Streptomyces cellostaticus]GHI06200.1 hypothetical protein Scel_45210 [Streptomyces cellostaticus]
MFFNDDPTAAVGDSIGLRILGMPSSWNEVTVTSPALRKPARLTPKSRGATDSAEVYGPGQMQWLRSDITPGTYTLTAAFHGRTVATTHVKVTAQADARIFRFTVWPQSARSGSRAMICFIDERAAPDEKSLVATSPAFHGAARLTTDGADDNSCPTADGSDTLYSGHVTLRSGLAAGSYQVKVVSHHGRNTSTQKITVPADARASRPGAGSRADSSDDGLLWAASGGAACLALVGVVAYTMRRRGGSATG